MPSPSCYRQYVIGWETNDGGQLIGDPRLNPWIIPELESEVIEIGLCPQTIKEVPPGATLDLAQVVAVWDEKHIAVARMYIYGVIGIRRTRPVLDKAILERHKAAPGTLREIHISGRRTSYDVQIFTRAELDRCVQKGHISASSPTGNPLHVTGCQVFIHSQTT